MFRRIILIGLFVLGLSPAFAQTVLPPNGPPMSIACAYNSALPTLATGNVGWIQCDSSGRLLVSGTFSAGGTTSNATSGQATSATNSPSVSYNYLYNGTTWDQWLDNTVTGAGNTAVVAFGGGAGTTSGALAPATAATGKITVTSTSITASTNTQIAAANTSRIAYGINCAGTGAVNISETGATLTSATFGATGATVQIPASSTPPYFIPAIATLTAITAYTATAQTCVVTEYNR